MRDEKDDKDEKGQLFPFHSLMTVNITQYSFTIYLKVISPFRINIQLAIKT